MFVLVDDGHVWWITLRIALLWKCLCKVTMHFLFILLSLCTQTHHPVDVIQARITNWEVRFSCACCFERGMGSNWLMAFTSGSNPVCSPKLTSQKLRESSAVIGSMFFKQLKPSWTSRMDNQVYQAAQSSEVTYFSIVFLEKKSLSWKSVRKSKFFVPIHFSKLWKRIMTKELFFKSTRV